MATQEDDPNPPRRGLRIAPRSGEVMPARKRPRRGPDEMPSEEDMQRFGDVTRMCPECRKEVFDDAAVCYHCGYAFERIAGGSARNPKWVVATIIVLIAIFVAAAFWGMF